MGFFPSVSSAFNSCTFLQVVCYDEVGRVFAYTDSMLLVVV